MKSAKALIGCTVATASTAPQAAVLAKSFLEFHPEARFAVLFVDPPGHGISVPATFVLGIADLGLPAGEEWRVPMLFHSRELTSLVKPVLFQTLLKRGAETVIWFESSTLILRPIDQTKWFQGSHHIVASPLIQNAFGDCGRSFIAVQKGAEAELGSWFGQSWNDNVATRSPVPGEDKLEAIEAVFERVPHAEITVAGFAVSYANLKPATFSSTSNGYQVEGKPLRSFDFRGYDSVKPHLLSRYQGLEPRILLSQVPSLTQLCDEYRARIESSRHRPDSKQGWDVLPSGLRLNHTMLKLYREALDKFRAGAEAEPRSPFGPDGERGFVDWLNEPIGQPENGVTRYMLGVHDEREDVEKAFPDPLGVDATGFRGWFLNFGRHELNVPDVLVPGLSGSDSATEAPVSPPPAVNVAGFFRAELGLGVAARSILTALDAAGIPFNTISYGATASRQANAFVDRQVDTATADLNIICINPDLFPAFAEETGRELLQGRYTIGVWFWEVEDFPESLRGAFNYVDEIWVASEFMREAFLKVSPKPVFKFRLPILIPQVAPSLSRADLGLPDRFTFFFSFDLLSVLERKNPLGLIKAFTAAFRDGEGPVLMIKTINGDKRCLEMEKLRYAVRGRSDIILMDGYLSQIENNTLTALADCYVSLHRSEGFGLTMAEAMALGKPTIATAYSGNLEFMTAENSYLCPARRVEVGPEREPYPSHSYWSEPDSEAAVGLLRHVYDCQAEARARGLCAARSIASANAPVLAGAIIWERLGTIRRRHAQLSPKRSTAFYQDRVEELEAENARLQAAKENA